MSPSDDDPPDQRDVRFDPDDDISDRRPATKWPPGVYQMKIADLERLGVDASDHLYWDGHAVQTRRSVGLKTYERVLALITVIAAVVGAVAAGVQACVAYADRTDRLAEPPVQPTPPAIIVIPPRS